MVPNGATLNILYIDDNESDLEIVSELLTDALGAQIFTATTGRAAKKMLETSRYDLIILDNLLPDTTGLEMLRAGVFRDPVILLTGFGGENVVREAFRGGCVDYLPKDEIGSPHFISTILEHVSKAPGESSGKTSSLSKFEKQFKILRAATEEMLKLSKFFKLAPWPMAYLKGADLVFEEANPPMSHLIGNMVKLLDGTVSLPSLFDPQVVAAAENTFRSGKRSSCTQVRFSLKDGSLCSTDLTFDTHRNERDEVDGLIMILASHPQPAVAVTSSHMLLH